MLRLILLFSITDAYEITSSVSAQLKRKFVVCSPAQMRPRARVVSCTSSGDALDVLDAPQRLKQLPSAEAGSDKL